MRVASRLATLSVCAISSVVAVILKSELTCDGSERFIVNTIYERGPKSFQGTFRLHFSKPLIFVLNHTVLLHPWLSRHDVRVELNFTQLQRDFAVILLKKLGDPSLLTVYYVCDLDIACDALCTAENRTAWKHRGRRSAGDQILRDECDHGYGLLLLSENPERVKQRWIRFCQNVSTYLKTENISVSLTYDPERNLVRCAFYTVLPIPCILYLEGFGAGLQSVLCVQYARNMTVGAAVNGTVIAPLPTNVSCWASAGNVYETEVARLEIREPVPTTVSERSGNVATIVGVLGSVISVAFAVVACAFRRKWGLTCLDEVAERARYRLVRVR